MPYVSAPLALRARNTAAHLVARVPSPGPRPLADPPPGSGLEPLMGEPGPPLIGHSLIAVDDSVELSRAAVARFGPVYWNSVFGQPIVFVHGPDALETVLANRDRAFASKPGWDYFIGPFFEGGVMLMDFEEHRYHRRIMQAAFKRARLVQYIAVANGTIEERLARWRPGRGFGLYAAVKQLTLDIATEVFMGHPPGPEADRLNRAFVDTVAGGGAIVRADVPGGKWHRGLAGRQLLADHFRAQLPAKRAGDGDDLFSVLCHAESEDGERFSDEDVVNHMIFTMMAAHDTSTITASMMALYLAQHPAWQDRLREESLALGKDAIGFEDLDALPSMDLVFRETLRMNAPVGVLARQAIADTAICGRYVPAGTKVMLALWASHRMEPWWQDPDRFDPERFTPERAEDKSHPYAWVPFGASVHKCIGMHFGAMEVKAIVHQLLLRFRWSVPAGYAPVMDYGTGAYPGDGLPITLERA